VKRLFKELKLYYFLLWYVVSYVLDRWGLSTSSDLVFNICLLTTLTFWLSSIWEEVMSINLYKKSYSNYEFETSFFVKELHKQQLRTNQLLEQIAASRGINVSQKDG